MLVKGHCTAIGKSTAFAGGTFFSHGRRYSNLSVSLPIFVARNLQVSNPPAPGNARLIL
jgi:hypothetical protein